MKVAFLVPWRSDDGGRRDRLWAFTRAWLAEHHPQWPIVLGESPQGPFNRGAAINDAARRAGGWEVAVIHDADTISDPLTLFEAVCRADETKGCVFPFGTYIYLDEFSTDRLIEDNNWFISPEKRGVTEQGFAGVIREHSSGIQAISREAWDKVGGFVELDGWGFEDCCTGVLLKTFASLEYLHGGAFHLWHPATRVDNAPNREILGDVLALSMVPDALRDYLRSGGHPIP